MRATTSNPKTLLFMAALVMVGCIALMMSVHSKTAHRTDLYSAENVFEMLNAQVNTQSGPCGKLEVSVCLFATNHDKSSAYYGRPSPQARAYCAMDARWGVMGVFGLAKLPEVVYVTGYQLPYEQWKFYNERDLCVAGDATYLKNLIVAAVMR